MIRNAKPGDIVWVANGRGPKAVVIEKIDIRLTKKKVPPDRGIYYKVKIMEEGQGIWSKGTVLDFRAMTLSRRPFKGDRE